MSPVSSNPTDPPPAEGSPPPDSGGLKRALKQRHMNLIALGGTIGAGLFVGSGVVIGDAGPSAVISFAVAGAIIVLIIRMLAEMTVARPRLGSFYTYVRQGLGHRAGFAVGWMYWYFWVIVVAVEAVAGGQLIQAWLPDVPLWVLCLALMALLTGTNLVSTRSYGEFEYWFSSVKIIAIVVFLAVGLAAVFGWWPDTRAGLGQLVSHGGFAPMGVGAMLAAVVPCIAFYTGAEIVTIAAAESKQPARAVAKATNSIIARVLLFYVGSVFLVVALVPWSSKSISVSPYAAVLDVLRVPYGATIMNAVVLVAVLSCLNSSLYTSSRMVFALTTNHDAPRLFTKLSRSGVPRRAILLGTVVGYIAVIFAFVSPDTVFSFLVNSYGAIALFVYLCVALAQIRMRRRLEREDPGSLKLKMWLFPWLSYVTVSLMVVVIVAMAILGKTRSQFWVSLITLAVVLIGYEFRRRRGPAPEPEDQPATVGRG